jgi:hypothetical protein
LGNSSSQTIRLNKPIYFVGEHEQQHEINIILMSTMVKSIVLQAVFAGVNHVTTAIIYFLINVSVSSATNESPAGAVFQTIIRNTAVVSLAAASVVVFLDYRLERSHGGRKKGSKNKRRTRLDIREHFHDMGPFLFRRNYRMDEDSFWKLLDIIGKSIPCATRSCAPNGPISQATRLSIALRYFAGGDPLDISLIHKVGSNEVLRSVWMICDAINRSTELDIKFPASHSEQMTIADGFRKKSKIGIKECAGAIDCMLVWTHKPSTPDIQEQPFGAGKMYCSRKHKYGLSMQAVADSQGKFLDVEIGNPGSASDYYCWHYSLLKQKVEKDGFLHPTLALFGDCAYINTPYLISPFKGATSGPKDAFNYFHSQVRINIECAFGILVHRWGILRKPIPMNISIKKTVSLVFALCKLHNFCIARKIAMSQPTAEDKMNIVGTSGGVSLPRMDSRSW